jgi:hypothetical protein
MQQQISGKGKIMTEISDLKERIKLVDPYQHLII